MRNLPPCDHDECPPSRCVLKPIKFRHAYHKLGKNVFTTIRGAAQFKRLKVGQIVPIEAPVGNIKKAKIIALELRRVKSMTIEFLNNDASYSVFVISSYADFVNLLNSFRAPMWSQVTEDSELTVITLEKMTPTPTK